MRETMIDSGLQRMVHRAGESPISRVYSQAAVHGRARRDHCRRGCRTVRASCGAHKIEFRGTWIVELSSACRGLLANVVGIVDRQVRAMAAHVADLRDGVLAHLLFQRKVPQLDVTRGLLAWRPERE